MNFLASSRGATFSLRHAIGGAAGTALTVTEVSGDRQMLKEKSPTDLKVINRKSLVALGASEKDAERF